MNVNPLGIDPILFTLGPVQVRWYGVMYVLSFITAGIIMSKMSKKGFLKIRQDEVEKYLTHLIIGMFLGARIFYVFIYNWDSYSHNLLSIFSIWEGGLSFHGAAFGMASATYLFAKKRNLHFFHIADTLCLCGAIGIIFGRLGNFINGELYGRVTTSAFGMIFPLGGSLPRHPSQLYESLTEGVLLSLILFLVFKRQRVYGMMTATFFCGYAFFRYCVEFFREADEQLGYYFGGTTTMGQILCIIMLFVGFGLFWYSKKLNLKVSASS